MDKKTKEINDNLVNFWNNAFRLTDDIKENDTKEFDPNYLALSPSEKFTKALEELSKKNNVLDYGCGGGFSSIILSKLGCKNVVAVDVAEEGIKSAEFYLKLYDAKNVTTMHIEPNYLHSEEECKYDGIICSNVLDVVPEEVSNDIIKGLARVAKEDSLVVIGMNYYIEPSKILNNNTEHLDNKSLFIDGVLRLVSKTDEEWSEAFSKYFNVEKLEHFSWPGEDTERRRLFYLRKK